MTEAPVMWTPCLPIPAGAMCAACGFGEMPVQDHCHEHGWVRAVVCRRCNQYLGSVDRHIRPAVDDEWLAALVAVRNRCPDCMPLDVANVANPMPKRAVTSSSPQDRWMRLRRLAARRGYKLAVVRYSGTYEVTLPKRPYRKTFASVDAVEEFLAR